MYEYFKDERKDNLSQKVFMQFIVIFFVVYCVLISFLFLFHVNYSYTTISGRSMQSTLNPNPVLVKTDDGQEYQQDGVYLKHTKDIDYNDIIVVDTTPPGQKQRKTIIKRVIGLEGDYVTIAKVEGKSGQREYHVMRVKENTNIVEVMEEEYVYSYELWTDEDGSQWEITVDGITYEASIYKNFTEKNYETKKFKVEELGGAEVVFFKVSEDSVFFLGDNRANSNDSRALGFLNLSKVEGKVVYIVRDGTEYKGNNTWWINRLKGFFIVIWQEILSFFGGNA